MMKMSLSLKTLGKERKLKLATLDTPGGISNLQLRSDTLKHTTHSTPISCFGPLCDALVTAPMYEAIKH
jgi:hypothetical protein